MRFRRNPLVHIIILVLVAGVAVIGVTSNHFGIHGLHRHATAPTVTVSPVSLSEQRQRLEDARTLRFQGRYAQAISSLQPVTISPELENSAAALLEIAKDQVALGDTGDAYDTLHRIRTRFAQSAAGDEAQFHLSQLEASRGDLAAAITDLQAYRSRHPEITGYIDLLIAKDQQQRGRLSDALKTAESVAASDLIDRARVEALEQMRTIQKIQKNDAAYLDATDQLLRLATIPAYRSELRYQRASAELRLGQKDAALADLRTVLSEYPDSGYAQNAIADLRKLAGANAVSDEQQALVAYDGGDYQSASVSFNHLVTADPANGRAWYYLAMSKLRNGDSWTAAVELKSMADRYPSSPFTPGALFTAGQLFEDEDDPDAALSVYQILIDKFGTSVEATNGRVRAGLILYQRGNFAAAINQFVAVRGSGSVSAEASFWEGKSFQQSGNSDRAKQAWTHASEADPTGFFGLRSAQLLNNENPITVKDPVTSLAVPLTPADAADLTSWYANYGTTVEAAQASVQQDPGFQRMNLLFDLGLSTQADWEMSALSDTYTSNPTLLGTFGDLLAGNGHYNEAFRVGLRLQSVADDSGMRLPRAMQRLAFPLAYPSLIETQASAHNVDPFLFLALIRQESGYDPSATSASDARGLAQVIPSTGKGLAQALRTGDFNADMLYRPAIAVQFGALYLADQLSHYNGQIYPALAGYNAGDGNVDKWLTGKNLRDPDLFVETIPFPETHDYVQIVYANFLNYIRIYR